jgi:hypothetical protein
MEQSFTEIIIDGGTKDTKPGLLSQEAQRNKQYTTFLPWCLRILCALDTQKAGFVAFVPPSKKSL